MSLLDDVSIVVTPNGYKAGELYAVIPVPTEGAEEITNGDFATDSDWGLGTGWSISGGTANCIGGAGSLNLTQVALEIGKRYTVTYTVLDYSQGTVQVKMGGWTQGTLNTSNGTYTEVISNNNPSANTTIYIQGKLDFIGSIDNVSVKEYTSADMDVTRATAATRVDENGLVNYAEIIGDEEITNGDFATDSNWTLSSGITYNASKYLDFNLSSGQAKNTPNITFVAGKTYKVSYEIKNYSAGTIKFRFQNGTNTFGSQQSGDGVKTEFVICLDSSNNNFQFFGSSSFVGSIDNVSVKEVIRDNVPRIDYTGGGCPHILAEPQRTNLITYSEELSATTNVTLSNTISPDGTLSGLKINETTSNSQHYSTSYGASVVSGGTIYTVSFYIKKGTYDLVKVYTQSRISASINITFSTESTSASGSDFISGSNFIEDAGNGWYRVGFSATANSTGVVSIYLPIKDLSTYVGSTSQYTEYWGVQLEVGSYPTSIIPTSGSTVTRNQDQFSRDGITSLINSTEGTLVIEPRYFIDDGSSRKISISDGTDANRIYITPFQGLASRIRYIFSSGYVVQADLNVGGIDITVSNKFAFVWATNRFELWQNGVKISEDTSGTTPSAGTFNQINFSSETGNGSEPFEGELKQLQVYKTALTDTQLAALTS